MKLKDILIGIAVILVIAFFVYPYIKKYIPTNWFNFGQEPSEEPPGITHQCAKGYIWNTFLQKCVWGEKPTCPEGYFWNPKKWQCEPYPIHK